MLRAVRPFWRQTPQRLKLIRTMATSTHFDIHADNTGLWHPRQTAEAAAKVTSLLQEDLESHHVFFQDGGFHNHIGHHLLSLYGTGASAAALQQAYDDNKGYQRRARSPHATISGTGDTGDTGDWFATTGAHQLLGRQSYYADFLAYFQRAIAADGGRWHGVLARHLLAGTPAADDLLVRLFAGFLHPLLQLQYGLIWDQPAGVAEGLAQACVHRPQGLDAYLLGAEARARQAGHSTPTESLRSLVDAVAADDQLAHAAHATDDNKLHGVLARAADALVAIAARVHVPATEAAVAARTAEMAETCVYVAAAAALHPPHVPKMDFFLIHHVTSIPFFLAWARLDDIPVAAKARLLEWKIRMDLAQYAARACPPLGLDGLRTYADCSHGWQPHQQQSPPPATIPGISKAAAAAAARFATLHDDGHAIKVVLATGLAEQALQPYADAPWRTLRDPQLWENIYRLTVDAVLAPGPTWVRTAGLEEAWKDVPTDNERETTVGSS